jgi:UDP-3-O-[3-hydroxymyristoyl] glucosamine N-acyltransferase
MRPTTLLPLAAFLLALAPAAHAKDKQLDCTFTEGKDDRIVQDKDLIIEPGEKVAQAVAVRGNVRVKKGAQVKDAVAINGSVILEPGASVQGDVVAVGGKVHAQAGAEIKGDAVALGGKLRADERVKIGGSRVSLQMDLDGNDMVQSLLSKVFQGRQKCRIVKEKAERASTDAG